MPERILTDGHGDRWDVRQHEDEPGRLVFRHQSGRTVTLESERRLDALENEELLNLLADSGRASGVRETGQAEDRSADPSGYVTRPEAGDRP